MKQQWARKARCCFFTPPPLYILSMRATNTKHLAPSEIQEIVNDGGKFVHYMYTISLLVVSLRLQSDLFLVKKNEKPARMWYYTIVSFLLGWWGIPFGPRYTLKAMRTNLKGGKDVTNEVVATMEGYLLYKEALK